MFGVVAPEMLPNWEFSSVSHSENVDHVREMAYTGAVHVVVNSTELFQRGRHHVFNTSFVGNVHFHRYGPERGMRGEFTALFGSDLGTVFIDICKNHTFGSGLSKSKGCLFANAASGLKEPSQTSLMMAWVKMLAPVTSATPNKFTVAMEAQKPGKLSIDRL